VLGAIAGDVIGSAYEFDPVKSVTFPLFSEHSRFTDDTVLTAAVAVVLLDGGDYAVALRDFGRRHPERGYGGLFRTWLLDPALGPYDSYGNGSAMRVGPVGLAGDSAEAVLREARRSAEVTHSHPEGIRGAQSVALAVFLAKQGADKRTIRARVEAHSGYDLGRSVAEIRPSYRFDESCQGSVPEALCCFLEARDYEGAVRLAISLGGDADTMAAIAGSVAAPFYGGVPAAIAAPVRALLTPELRGIVDRFDARYGGTARAGTAE